MRYLLLALMLAGCATQDERIAAKAPSCEKMGYEKGSDAFRNCQLQLYQTDQQRRNAVLQSN